MILGAEEQKSKEYKQKCLTGKFPSLETQDGNLFESAAIARYLARLNPDSKLAGIGAHESSQIDQWIDFIKSSVFAHAFPIFKGTFGFDKVDADSYNNALKEVKSAI